jgi:hypothetical protein
MVYDPKSDPVGTSFIKFPPNAEYTLFWYVLANITRFIKMLMESSYRAVQCSTF